MADPVEPPAGPPLGFPSCPQCTYLRTGPPRVCFDCASQAFEIIQHGACPVCSQMLDEGSCPNWLCQDPARRIERIHAIAYLSGPLRAKIVNYKYRGKTGWRLIFGRLLVGWLNQHGTATSPDLIVANPTYIGPDGASFGHTEAVLDAASAEDVLRRWPFDIGSPRVIVKTAPTPKSARNTAPAKRAAARALRGALRITDPLRTQGQSILVYDDVCTTGSQLDAIADCLLEEGGAAHVEAVVLARAPWRSRT